MSGRECRLPTTDGTPDWSSETNKNSPHHDAWQQTRWGPNQEGG